MGSLINNKLLTQLLCHLPRLLAFQNSLAFCHKLSQVETSSTDIVEIPTVYQYKAINYVWLLFQNGTCPITFFFFFLNVRQPLRTTRKVEKQQIKDTSTKPKEMKKKQQTLSEATVFHNGGQLILWQTPSVFTAAFSALDVQTCPRDKSWVLCKVAPSLKVTLKSGFSQHCCVHRI